MSEESADSHGRTGEDKEQRLYWKEVQKKVEIGVNITLENARTARHALYEKQVKELGDIVDPTSSEGEEEGEAATRRRTRRKEREEVMGERRKQKAQLYAEYLESRRKIIVEEKVIRDMRRQLENQLERKKEAKQARKKLRARQRAVERKKAQQIQEAREERKNQAARRREQQEEEDRGDEKRKRKSEGRQGEQTPQGNTKRGVQTRSTSRSSAETPEEAPDVSIILAPERGLPAEGEIFAHFTRLLGKTPTTGAEWDIEVSQEGADQPLFIKGYKLTLPVECLQQEGLEGPLAVNEMHTERWGVWQIAVWNSEEDEVKLGCVARMRGKGGPQAWTGVMELPAVTGGFLNVKTPEGNEVMQRQIQEVLRKAGDTMERGTEEEKRDLRGVEVNSVQQLYVNVRGMRTSAATNKCEFGYTTPSGKELNWGPTKFTLYAEFHKRSQKVKEHTARTYHTVRGALVLNEQTKWCELCAWAHGKDCEKRVAYRVKEARRTQELLDMTKRDNAPTRAQQQAGRPEYTLSVEQEKQVKTSGTKGAVGPRGERDEEARTDVWMSMLTAGARGSSAQGVRGVGERRRRSKRGTTYTTEQHPVADSMPRLSTAPWELPLSATQVQVLPMQPPATGREGGAQRSRAGRGEEGAHAGVATGWQRWKGRRKGGGSGTQRKRGKGGQRHRRSGRTVRGDEEGRARGKQKSPTRKGKEVRWKGEGHELMGALGKYITRRTIENCTLSRAHDNKPGKACAMNCVIHTLPQEEHTNVAIERRMERRQQGWMHACRSDGVQLNGNLCAIACAIQAITHRQSTLKNDEHMERMQGTEGQAAQPLVKVGAGICGIVIIWLMRMRKGCEGPTQEKHTKNNGRTKASSRAKSVIRQRRLMQQRIKRWNITRKVKYDYRDRKKYRHKIRASLRWMRRNSKTEAKEANIRESRNRAKEKRERNMKRKGRAGGRVRAKQVEASTVEEELMRDLGVPQHTWGDGSCWLWAVAGALQKLEGKEAPTENDIRLEREWRAAIQDTVKTHDIPITDEEFRGLGEGVQYTHGKLTRGGTWGGGTEHQALAIILKVNIVIWDRRYIGRVGAQHRQLYVCTPQGNTYLRNVLHASELIKQSDFGTIHVLYDDVAKHYEYFGRNAIDEIVGKRPGPAVQEMETGERKKVMEEDKVKDVIAETSRSMRMGEGGTMEGNRIGTTNTREGRELQRSEVHLGTLNISGIAFGYRGKYMKTEEELLKIRPGDKLREVTEMMKTQGFSLMTLTDTHLNQEGMTQVGKFLQQEGLEGGGIAAKREIQSESMEYSARKRAGIYYIWDPTKISVNGIKEVHVSRVARVSIHVLDSGKEIEVYGVYMPVRDNKAEKTEEIWEALMQDITERGTRNFIVNGDFNAETEAWIIKNGRIQKEEDVIFQGVIEDLNLVASVTEDYTFERAQTQIDNILVPIELIHNLKEAYATTGVREKDHKLVMATLAWEMKGEKGALRPMKRHTDKLQETQWLKYERILQERANEIQERLGSKKPSDKLRIIHHELTKAAADVAGEILEMRRAGEGEVDGFNSKEEKELNKEEGNRERKRNQVFKWSRHLYHARRYTGGKGKEGGFWRRKEIKQDYIMNKLAKDDRRARRARVIEICEEWKEKTEEQLKGIRREMSKTTNTDALFQSLMSLGKGTGNVVIRVFDIIKKGRRKWKPCTTKYSGAI